MTASSETFASLPPDHRSRDLAIEEAAFIRKGDSTRSEIPYRTIERSVAVTTHRPITREIANDGSGASGLADHVVSTNCESASPHKEGIWFRSSVQEEHEKTRQCS
jgi:hypothetical protein